MLKLTLLISFFILISTRTNLDRRRELAENLIKLIEENEKNKFRSDNIWKLYKNTRVLFYGVQKDKVKDIQKRFDLSDKIISDIKAAPFIDNSGSLGVILDESNFDLSGDLSNCYNEFSYSLGTAFMEKDIIYFLLINVKSHVDFLVNGKEIWYEECKRVFLFKDCQERRRVEFLPFTAEQQQGIKLHIQYQMYLSLLEHIKYLEDYNIQAYISENSIINSEDDKAVAFIGYFGDIAIGPKKYLSSIEEIKKVQATAEGHITYFIDGDYVSFCNDKDPTDISCNKIYGGQFIHKFQMLTGKVNPRSTSTTHRNQMDVNQKNGPYALILYLDGQLEYRSVNSKLTAPIIWTSNTKGKGQAPYEIKVSSDYKLGLYDSEGNLIYQSFDYINIPSIRYGGEMQDAEYLDRYNGYQGGRSHGGVMARLRMGIDDEDYQKLTVTYSIYRHDGTWTTNTSPFQILGGTRIYYPYSLKITLNGENSNKFKICYKTSIRNQKDKNRNRESPIVCDGQATELADFEAVGDYISGYQVIITTPDDKNIQ